jgi:hypothetical protein
MRPYIFSILVSLCVWNNAVLAATIHVPSDQPTIAEGLAHAFPGDTVLVAPGVYLEHLIDMQRGVVLTSEEGPAATIIDGSGTPQGLWTLYVSGAGPSTEISGFTLHHSWEGIRCDNSYTKIRNNIFREFLSDAIALEGCGATVEDNLFLSCHGAVDISIHSDDSSIISSNTITGSGGAALELSGFATSTSVLNNIVTDAWVGIGCVGGGCNPPPDIRCNDVWGNSYADYFGLSDLTGWDGNISEDPLFCDPLNEDYGIEAHSPCAPGNSPPGCGLIGLYPVSCGVTATTPLTWGCVRQILR